MVAQANDSTPDPARARLERRKIVKEIELMSAQIERMRAEISMQLKQIDATLERERRKDRVQYWVFGILVVLVTLIVGVLNSPLGVRIADYVFPSRGKRERDERPPRWRCGRSRRTLIGAVRRVPCHLHSNGVAGPILAARGDNRPHTQRA